jgi:teichuronic acid exporter
MNETAERRAQDRLVVRGIAWTAAGKWAAQLATWASTIVVARLLTPVDYGVVGMAALFLGFVQMVAEFGIGAAVLAMREPTEEEIAQLNTLSVLIGIAMFALASGAAPFLAAFFRTGELTLVVIVLSSSFVVTALRSIPNALMQRELRFKRLAVIEVVRGVLTALVGVSIALSGRGYWALVLSELGGHVVVTVLTISAQRHRFAWPRMGAIDSAVALSGRLMVGRISWYVYSNADFLIAGRVLGKAPLGNYELAWTLANLPVEKVTTMVTGVAPALFASVQKDQAVVRRYLGGLTEAIAVIAFPVAIGLCLVADDAVPLVLGPRWVGVVVPLQLLSLYTAVRSVMPLLPIVLTVCGQARFLMYHGLSLALAFPVAFYLGSRWGTVGIAGAWLLLYPISIVPLFYVLAKVAMPIGAYLDRLRAPGLSTLAMAASVLGVRALLPDSIHAVVRLCVLVAIGGLVYAGLMLVVFRERVSAFVTTLRAARSGELERA